MHANFSKRFIYIWKSVIVVLLIAVMIPFSVKADDPVPVQPENEGDQDPLVWLEYSDDEWGMAFEYLSSWSISEQNYSEDNQREIELFNDLDGRIIISKVENPENLTPQQWFEQSRNQYNDLIQIITETNLRGIQTLIVGLPDSCSSVPLLQAILFNNGHAYRFTYFGTGSKTLIIELKRLLETFAFGPQPTVPTASLPDAYFTIPQAPDSVVCPTEAPNTLDGSSVNSAAATSTTARMCSGAEFYIPTEGTLFSPFECFNSSYCSLYATGGSGEFGKPHSGLDIMGNKAPGVTPIVATGSGGVYSVGDSAIRIIFDPPWDKYSAYSAHMATGLGSNGNYQDFRVLKTGDRAIAGDYSHPIGYMGNYDSTRDWGTSNVHLHISFDDGGASPSDYYPTSDPTIFLKAKYLKYYPGWNNRGPITCADSVGSGAVDVFFLVDLSGSFDDDLPNFKNQAPSIIASLKSKNPNTRFGLGAFEDYPIYPFGEASYGDTAYRRIVDLTTDSTAIINAINGLYTRSGYDIPESQLTALFQAATGAGQDLSWAGYSNASIPAGQGASFRKDAEKIIMLWTDAPFHNPGDLGDISYPGPSKAEVASAVLSAGITTRCDLYPCPVSSMPANSLQAFPADANDENGPRASVIGISSGGEGVEDLEEMARLTGAIAPEAGVDCDNDGFIDIVSGEPLVCGISSTGEGLGAAVTALVDAALVPSGTADTTGVFRPSNGLLYLKNKNDTGFADMALNYGLPGDYPVVGDWDGNGTVTIGIYRNGKFYLRNENTIGFADMVFAFGLPGDQPVAGDWDGDGVDTIGVYRSSTGQFLLRNSNTAGDAEMSFFLGNYGDVGIAGDWDGDGLDTTGVFRPSNGVIFLKNTNDTGYADIALNYGLPGDKPVMGDWNGDGIDTIGIYRSGIFYLRNSNTNGFAEIVFALGIPGDHPIAGDWDALP